MILIATLIGMIFEEQIGVKLCITGCVGAILLILTGVISEKNALKSIDLKTIFLFGGTLSLAKALEVTGAGELIADKVIGTLGENPSPGNKAGGISTLEEKALGCTQKCGKSYVSGVMPYGERLQKKGLNLLSAPGNDLVAATTLAASGCHMVLFTTGRGTPFGTFVPTMKISTNSTLAKNKPGWIDFNAGVIVENEPMEKTCERFIDYIIKVASGEFVNNEKKGYREIAIFKTGVTL